MNAKVLFLTADNFEDMELFYPLYRMREQGADITIASPTQVEITGKHGYSIGVAKECKDIDPDDYDLLILPGGSAPELVRLDPDAQRIAKSMMDAGKLVAAICHGIQTLITVDAVKGRRATCWKGIRDDLKAAGGDYRDEPCVVDGNLITSRAPDDLPIFCKTILDTFQGEYSSEASKSKAGSEPVRG
jgi:protease I